MLRGKNDLFLRLPLMNNPDLGELGMTYAHEAFELILKHEYKKHPRTGEYTYFSEKDLLKINCGIQPGERVDRNRQDVKDTLQYPLRNCWAEIILHFGVKDIYHAGKLLNGKTRYNSVNDEVWDALAANRMDLIMLSPEVSPKQAHRGFTHTASFWDMMTLNSGGQYSDDMGGLRDKRIQPQHAPKNWEAQPFFMGLLGATKKDGKDREPSAVMMGRFPDKVYVPTKLEQEAFERGEVQNWRTINRHGRGYVIIVEIGVVDMYRQSYVAYMHDFDTIEELPLASTGEFVSVRRKKLSLYSFWRLEHCPVGYRDLRKQEPQLRVATSSAVEDFNDDPVIDQVNVEVPTEEPNREYNPNNLDDEPSDESIPENIEDATEEESPDSGVEDDAETDPPEAESEQPLASQPN